MKPCLDGQRVLDLSRILAGPWTTQLLADLGADVIKIERPGEGDDTRGWGPPFVSGEDETDLFSAYYLAANRGKKSVSVDFSVREGRDIVCALIASPGAVRPAVRIIPASLQRNKRPFVPVPLPFSELATQGAGGRRCVAT
jgi:crotonobetainyl-CoA:carnitine CoA-transferase CaiB-like acyl-CoA transferase